jgi:hypothetical protein
MRTFNRQGRYPITKQNELQTFAGELEYYRTHNTFPVVGEQKFNFDKLPDEVKKFVENHPEQPAQDWAEKLMTSSPDMPIEELEKWVNNMPVGMFRAEMRGVLNQRKPKA